MVKNILYHMLLISHNGFNEKSYIWLFSPAQKHTYLIWKKYL